MMAQIVAFEDGRVQRLPQQKNVMMGLEEHVLIALEEREVDGTN